MRSNRLHKLRIMTTFQLFKNSLVLAPAITIEAAFPDITTTNQPIVIVGITTETDAAVNVKGKGCRQSNQRINLPANSVILALIPFTIAAHGNKACISRTGQYLIHHRHLVWLMAVEFEVIPLIVSSISIIVYYVVPDSSDRVAITLVASTHQHEILYVHYPLLLQRISYLLQLPADIR